MRRGVCPTPVLSDGSAAVTPTGGADPELVQLLTPEGERVDHPDYDLDLSDDEYRGLYRDLVLVRRIDVEATALQRQGELGLWAALLGQEAAQVGSGRALRPQDFAFPTYREHGVAWCRGRRPAASCSACSAASTNGGWDPHENNFALYTIVIGAQTLHATGYAMGIAEGRRRSASDDGEAVIAYFGDGASSQGDVNEAFVWAGVFNAPVVFFCQNNQWAISEPLERQTRIPLYQRAARLRLPRRAGRRQRRARVARRHPRALDAAREGRARRSSRRSPTGWARTPRPTTRPATGSRASWRRGSSRTRSSGCGRTCYKQQLADADFFDAVDARPTRSPRASASGCLAMPDPDPPSMFDHVYAERAAAARRGARGVRGLPAPASTAPRRVAH